MLGQMRATAAPAPESAGHQEPEASNLQMVSVVGDETSNWGLIQAVAGTAIMMLLFSVSAIGASIIEEKEQKCCAGYCKASTCIQPAEWKTDLRHDHCTFFSSWSCFCLPGWRSALPVGMNLPGLILMIVVTALCCSSFVYCWLLLLTAKTGRQPGTIIILSCLLLEAA